MLSQLGLGHLSLNQEIKSLSGGENQRIKLSKALGDDSKLKIFGLDELLKGLGKREMLGLIQIIYENIEQKGKTFIVSEHNQDFINLCTNICELVRENGKVKIIQKS